MHNQALIHWGQGCIHLARALVSADTGQESENAIGDKESPEIETWGDQILNAQETHVKDPVQSFISREKVCNLSNLTRKEKSCPCHQEKFFLLKYH